MLTGLCYFSQSLGSPAILLCVLDILMTMKTLLPRLGLSTAAIVAILALTVITSLSGSLAKAQAPPANPPSKPAPDVLVFTNGDQLTGKLERGVGDSIVFNSDMAGEITVPLSKIKELRSASSFAVLRKNVPITRVKVEAGPIKTGDGNITVTRSNAAPETIADKDLAYIIDADTYNKEVTGHAKFKDGWNGAFTGGITLVQSTSYGSTYTAGISLVRAIPTVPWIPRRDRTIFNLNETYGKLTQPVIPQTDPPTPDSVAKTNIFHTDIEQDKYFSPRFYVLGIGAFDHNYSQGLNFQQLYGGGIGWTAIQSPKQQLDFNVNVHYERQNFQSSLSNQNLIGATIGETYLRNLPHKIVFTESASYLPAFNNNAAYSANFAAGVALPVYHRFSFVFNTTDNYLNNPSPGYKANSFQFVTGITYTLH